MVNKQNLYGYEASGEQPLVSIIVITYNQEKYIEEAILSCINQTYINLEIIVSDDASTDETVGKIIECQGRDPRVKLLANTVNCGITKNCQNALNNCNGKYIAIMGGDDFLYPEKIYKHVVCMEMDDNIALSFCQCHIILGENPTPIRTTATASKDDVSNGYELASGFGVEMPGPAPVVRSSCVPSGGFRSLAPIASDWLFFIETAQGKKCKLIKMPLAVYRIHSNNIGNRRYSYINDYINSYRFIEDNYSADMKLVQCAKNGLRRYLFGTCYASIIELNHAATAVVLRNYREIYGMLSFYFVLKLASLLPLGALFSLLKRLLKKFV